MNLIIDFYLPLSVFVGCMHILENTLLFRKGSKFNANAEGKAKGLDFIFMIFGMFWIGASILHLVRFGFSWVPAIYLGIALSSMLLTKTVKDDNGLIVGVEKESTLRNLVLSVAFSVIALVSYFSS